MSEERKGMYHSELVKLGEIDAEVLSNVTPSKYQGKPPWVALRIQGRERYYSCENEACAEALRNLRGQTIHLQATGDRQNAEIHVQETEPRRVTPEAREDHNAQFDPIK